jgi:cell division protein FtsN
MRDTRPGADPNPHDGPTMNLQRHPISIFGFLGGLICGLALSVAIALYLTNSPVPFISKVQHATENITPEPGDPNRPLFSPQIPAGVASDPAAARAAIEAGDGPNPLPGAAAPGPIVAVPVAPATPGATAGTGRSAAGDAGPDGAARLMLQVGAFKNADDADVLRARIALLGLDAKVTANLVDGATLYRVRLGPYGPLDDLNGIRKTLSENGMEPQLVHIK